MSRPQGHRQWMVKVWGRKGKEGNRGWGETYAILSPIKIYFILN